MDSGLLVAIGPSIIAGITTLVLAVVTYNLNKRERRSKHEEEERAKKQDELNEQNKQEKTLLHNACNVLINIECDRLKIKMREYINNGSVPIDERVAILRAWEDYESIGGNGELNSYLDVFKSLPIEKKEE